MKQQIKLPWKSNLPKFWKTARRYRWLMIWLLVSMFFLISNFYELSPYYPPTFLKPDVLIPQGFFSEPSGRFSKSFVFYLEKPNKKRIYTKPNLFFPASLNTYLTRKAQIEKDFEQSKNNLEGKYDLFPVIADGVERILLFGKDTYLLDLNYHVIDKEDSGRGFIQYIISAKFRDRLWIQIGDGGNGGWLRFYELSFTKDKIQIKKIGQGYDEDYETYQIRNSTKNPKAIIYKKATMTHLPLILWIYYISINLKVCWEFAMEYCKSHCF